MAVQATGGDRSAPEGPQRSGGRRIAGFFDLREEADQRQGGEKSQATPLREGDRGAARTFRR
jgi:hypothetical protein